MKTVKQNPGRVKEPNKEVETMSVKIVAQYALLGPYDFCNILEASDNETISRVATELGSRGVMQTLTVAALTMDDFITRL